MSNVIVDGFGHYGTNATIGLTGVAAGMLSGAWAQLDTGYSGITTVPWDLSNFDSYLVMGPTLTSFGARRVLPSTLSTAVFSFYFGVPSLPTGVNNIITFRNGSNAIMGYLQLTSTGALQLCNSAQTVIASTSGPVIVAQSVVHLEMKLTPGSGSNGTFQLNADETTLINASSLVFSVSGNIGQFSLGDGAAGSGSVLNYYSHLIVRSTSGTYNNSIVGDRKVATLLVNNNGADTGWTPQYLHKFGNGILSNGTGTYPSAAATLSGVYSGFLAGTDLSNVDFTVEGWFRFQSLPTGSNKAVLFGKWDEGTNYRSWQLYQAGPSLDNGNLEFRTSTDGTAGTVSILMSYPYAFVPGVWYHVAVARASASLGMAINGVWLGTPTSDSSQYKVGGTNGGNTVLGAQLQSGALLANTNFAGWNDEFRLTQGFARYTPGTNFSAPSAAFPRGSGSDAHWSDVYWLSGWDAAAVVDESGYSTVLSAGGSAAAVTPGDGGFAYQTIDKARPIDDNFIEASDIAASNIFTQTVNFSNADTVTIATQDGTTAAVYTAQTSLTNSYGHFLIGASITASLTNLVSAINAGAGSGTTYAAATTLNHDVTATLLNQGVQNQIQVVADTPGTAGNSLASTTTAASGSWAHASTLTGGISIPGDSTFRCQSLPSLASVADSLTLIRRSWKTDAGTCTTTASLVGVGGTAVAGATISESVSPTLYGDLFEADPDNSGNPISVTAINLCSLKINRAS